MLQTAKTGDQRPLVRQFPEALDMSGSKQRSGTVVGDLANLLESGCDSDVTLVAGGARIAAHRLIMSARSPVFAAILRRHQREACLEVPDMEEDVLRQLLSFIYTDEVPELDTLAPQLLVAADKYDLQVLKDRCEQQLLRDLCVENAAAVAVLAVQRSCPTLRRAVVDFVRTHSISVMGTQGWSDALYSHPKAIAEISRLVSGAPQPESRTPLQRAGSSQEIYRAPRGREDLASRRALGVVRTKSDSDGFADKDETQSSSESGTGENPESSAGDSGDVTDWFAVRMAKAAGPKSGPLSPHSQTPTREPQSSVKSPPTEDNPESNNKPELETENFDVSNGDYPWWFVPSETQQNSIPTSDYFKSKPLPTKSQTKSRESLSSAKPTATEDRPESNNEHDQEDEAYDIISNDELPWWYIPPTHTRA